MSGFVEVLRELFRSALSATWAPVNAVALLAVIGLMVFCYTTRAGVIARATTKEAVRQPIFLLALAVAVIILVLNTFLPFFSLGDDVKMLKDCGLATMLIAGILISIWTASTSIADEIEGKTAMTLLSKPVNRRQFVLGKYVGIMQAVLWFMIPASLVFLYLVYFKVGYDAKESSLDPPTIAAKLSEMIQIVPGLLLIFLEISVLTALSVAISTRMPMVVNLTTMLAIFVVGHLTPILVQSGDLRERRLEPVEFVAKLIATVLPSLELFNTQAAVATKVLVPPVYLGQMTLYTVCYAAVAILLAFILFEDRDLA
ncbi:MAG TPA: ABC transporter permease subunit [Planctomycetaceae bacterium]|nr:ABC transporter permease subunit [Planctomycetaceae bacterium]